MIHCTGKEKHPGVLRIVMKKRDEYVFSSLGLSRVEETKLRSFDENFFSPSE